MLFHVLTSVNADITMLMRRLVTAITRINLSQLCDKRMLMLAFAVVKVMNWRCKKCVLVCASVVIDAVKGENASINRAISGVNTRISSVNQHMSRKIRIVRK